MASINQLTLYQRPDCPFCWKVRLFLFESELPVNEIQVELEKKHPDVVSLNPNATVPVLVAGELVVYDSALIVEYLLDKYPEINLMDGTPEERAVIREIQKYSDTSLGKILFPYIKYARENPNSNVDEQLENSTAKGWLKAQSYLAEKLGNKDFFGTEFSVADCALIPRFTLANTYGFKVDDKFSNLKKWYARCMERPSFKKAFKNLLH